MAIGNLARLRSLFAGRGVRTLYIKHLSAKQDNEKNQIYLGKGLDGILNLFPATIVARSASESVGKRRSAAGKPKLEARLRLAWLGENGETSPAPDARIIDYFQYPEARLSGFIKGCANAPDALRRNHQAQYGRRILVLGTAPDGTVLGRVLTERDDPVVADFPDLPVLPAVPVLRVLSIAGPAGVAPYDLLLAEITAIAAAGWHPSVILKPGAAGPVPFRGNQGAGYTLEALLGVVANAGKAPDAHGYEIKSFRGDKISLMTPTPDGGFQGTHTFREFMGRYGRPAVKGDGSMRFTGTHRVGLVSPTTGFGMRVRGYDAAADTFDADAGIAVEMFHPGTGDIVASWSLERLANSWNAKHASAMYVPATERASPGTPGSSDYRFGPHVLVGEGTDVFRLIRAIHDGVVWYDPADSIYIDNRAKVRPQWRTSAGKLEATMGRLYGASSVVILGD
ncbi:MvaI/BcnI family restriction endonuclease [Sphingomonas oligophenolica]|nr:MvaI/BcnI family restriction endonuclease [Sphingomonas oligophenolica]